MVASPGPALAPRGRAAYPAGMAGHPRWSDPTGPFRADQIHEGDHYELSQGHAIHCMTAGERHGSAHAAGVLTIATAAIVPKETGIDVGVAWNEGKNLRAPDLSSGRPLTKPGWASEAPPLAIEYASTGQDEEDLTAKIAELIALGTRIVWVVRLTGPLRVEVHEPGVPVRVVDADGALAAPGVLEREVPVRALIDPDAALETALHNILAKKGYRNLDAVREEGREQGREQGLEQSRERLREVLRVQLAARGWTLSPSLVDRVAGADLPTLARWLMQSATASDVEAALR